MITTITAHKLGVNAAHEYKALTPEARKRYKTAADYEQASNPWQYGNKLYDAFITGYRSVK